MKLERLSVIVPYFQQRELKSIGITVQDFTLIIHIEFPILQIFHRSRTNNSKMFMETKITLDRQNNFKKE